MPALDIGRDAAHDAAQRELGKPIYPRPSLTERLSEWFDELLYRIAAEGSTVPGGWFTISVLILMLVVALFVALRVARRTLRTNRGVQPLFAGQELSAVEHRATAEQFAAAGDWASAIRHRLRAVARHLEQTGVLAPVPGRTATELARDAGAALPGLATELGSAATAFNDVTYGERPGTESAYRLIAGLDDHLRSRTHATSSTGGDSAPAGGWAGVR
ncbi:DUF4129 domain-containing protein [Mycobacterium manitobense]|uniref:DUF4129 domain-containing protein n=2 Tax=Mycolicibacterium TaxID=1866885 RepID=A0A9X2YUK3_9MYCO|nr:DUF4129 domain-containing protein [[Mycobacterium] manitobense]MCV7173620.1 DUF4129 domain-containing protein [[Mycobacterium] manitobense]